MMALLLVILTGLQATGSDTALLLDLIHQLLPIRPARGHKRVIQQEPIYIASVTLPRYDPVLRDKSQFELNIRFSLL